MFLLSILLLVFISASLAYFYMRLSANNKQIAILMTMQSVLLLGCMMNAFWNLLIQEKIDEVQVQMLILKGQKEDRRPNGIERNNIQRITQVVRELNDEK